jgi:phage/plasmid-associated DNA primase
VKEIETLLPASECSIEYDESATLLDPKIMIQNLLPILSLDRFKVEPFWKEVGQILYNTFGGHDQGLELFISYSSKCSVPERDAAACTKYYRTLSPNYLTVKTIAWYARHDNPKMYETWHAHWLRPALFESFSLIHDDVAQVVYRVFWLEHIWVGGSRWYHFRNHRLIEEKEESDLRRDITNKLIPIFKRLRAEYEAVSSSETTAVNRKLAESTIKNISALIEKLGNHAFKSIIIKAARQLFEVTDFDRIKDSDPNKTGWANCVIACSGEHAYAIDGKLEDFITKSTFCPYRSDLHWEHPLVKKLLTWFGQMFPDPDLKHYVLKDMASQLYGRNAEKLLRAWCGEGNNSKTMLAKCMQSWLGLYCVDFPPTFLTGKQIGSSGPNPELAQAHGAHTGFIPETEDDEKIREGTAKRATGGDRQFARMCNENGGPMEMMVKLILMCNKIPEFTSITKALRNRFIYIPFLSTWADDAPEALEAQYATRTFKNDPFFDAQLPELGQALGWVAVQYYHYYKVEGLVQPRIVTEYTERHWEENDPMAGFIGERLQQVYLDADRKLIDTSRSLTASEIYPVFKAWFAQNYPGVQVITQPSFKVSLQQHLGPQTNRRWCGIALTQAATVLGGGGDTGGFLPARI